MKAVELGVTNPYRVSRPWARMFEWQFRDHERKRLDAVFSWMERFRSTLGPREQDEVVLYVVPLKLDSHWRSQTAEVGTPIGHGAIYNCDAAALVGIIPHGKPVPEAPDLIRIRSSHRKFQHVDDSSTQAEQTAIGSTS